MIHLRNTAFRWGVIAKSFHWIMALGILGNGLFGLLMDQAASRMQKLNWLALHKSIGLTVLALVLLRLVWRRVDGRPCDESAPRWQQRSARMVHGVLYLLMLLMPLTGWLFNSVAGKPLQWFKLFNLPALLAKDGTRTHLLHAVHEYLFWFLLLMLIGHVGAALKHHFFDEDNVLRRMWPLARPTDQPVDERAP